MSADTVLVAEMGRPDARVHRVPRIYPLTHSADSSSVTGFQRDVIS